MTDFLDILAIESIERVSKGYYDVQDRVEREPVSLVEAITTCKRIPVVAEIKKRSPSLGYLRDEIDPVQVSIAFKNGGAVGISVITEPNRFEGSLQLLRGIRETVHLPLLMKDIVAREVQVEAASRLGADVVLLIATLFDRCYRELSVQNMINFAHSKNLEVILETHNEKEFSHALDTDADIIGINNRDLRDLSVNLETAYKILKECKPNEKIVIVESGIQDRNDLNKLLEVGADAFLIGSSIMKARDIEEKLREFTMTNENC